MAHDILFALGVCFGILVMAFGCFYWWLVFRSGDDRDARLWGLLAGASNVAVGLVILAAAFLPPAVPYAAALAATLLIVRMLARRRLKKAETGLR